jgi:2',3'-cyclic-nucleotide 2'-phosphodiesterase (5'-nucleotidase family)
MKLKLGVLGSVLLLLAPLAATADDPDAGPNSAAQCAADALKDYAQADGAFIPARLLNSSFDKAHLATLLKYPTDTVETLSLTGAQIRLAFERSISFYPQPISSFLQISGFDVVFKKGASPNQRIVSISTPTGKLDDAANYNVAMPKLLAEGGEGYFKIWEHSKTVKTFGKTLEEVLVGKAATDTAPRWTAQG